MIKEGQNKEAFAYVERSKARAMVDLLASKREFSSEQTSQEDITKLLSQIDKLEQQPVILAKDGTRGLKMIKQKVLAADNDGRLTVSELYETRMDADLVTLSACETALGKVANGDDVVGFTRGFLYAGANSIVSSLWKVDDKATSILMYQFYQNLTNMDKRTALPNAQLAMIAGNNSHPFYWSAFQLTGMQ